MGKMGAQLHPDEARGSSSADHRGTSWLVLVGAGAIAPAGFPAPGQWVALGAGTGALAHRHVVGGG